MKKTTIISITLVLAIVALFFANLAWGSVSIPLREVLDNETYHYIVMESRLPNAITALLAGAALATSGLLLQTAFRNPLAGPDVFGISSGAALAVAVVMLAFGGNISIAGFSIGGFLSLDGLTIGGFLAILISAFAGAMLVMGIITLFSAMVRNQVVLLIIGIMVGYLASSGISLLNFFSSAEGMKSYMIWGMGNMGNVSMAEVSYFATVTLIGLLLSLLLVKPLNALLLGEQYAENLGFNIRRLRVLLLVVTGLLTAVVTAFCGPIAFIGLATPHIVRLLIRTDNHRQLLPLTMLMGSAIALLCNALCVLPAGGGIIPLNAFAFCVFYIILNFYAFTTLIGFPSINAFTLAATCLLRRSRAS